MNGLQIATETENFQRLGGFALSGLSCALAHNHRTTTYSRGLAPLIRPLLYLAFSQLIHIFSKYLDLVINTHQSFKGWRTNLICFPKF